MQKTTEDAGDGLSTANIALKKLNLSFVDLTGKAPEKQFEIIAKQLLKIHDIILLNQIMAISSGELKRD